MAWKIYTETPSIGDCREFGIDYSTREVAESAAESFRRAFPRISYHVRAIVSHNRRGAS